MSAITAVRITVGCRFVNGIRSLSRAISGEMATVSAPNWYVTQEIPLADLRLIE
jgi:hypothetical protein